MDNEMRPLTDEELMSEQATALPDKEVASVLDLNADLDLGLHTAAPIDLAVAANANVAAPIDASASANILSFGSDAQALSHQDAAIDQGIVADANANSAQDSVIGQGDGSTGTGTTGTTGTTDPTAGTAPAPTGTGGATSAAGALNGNLLNVDVNLNADAAIAAPINGAVAANANVAAPIDASVAANIGSIGSQSYAISDQSASIAQHIDGAANATAGQQSNLQQ